MTSLVVLSLLAGVPLPQECEPPPLHDVAPLKTFAQKSGTLSVGLDSVATWCFDSGGAWTGGQRPEPGKKPKPIDPKAAPVGDCARALTSCEDAREALSAELMQALLDALGDLERPWRGQKYPPRRSGLNERPPTNVNCKERSRPDLFAQAQARMDLARLASTVQNEYANYKTWLFARGLECAQQVKSGRVDTTRVAVSVDSPVGPGTAGGAAGKGTGGGTASTPGATGSTGTAMATGTTGTPGTTVGATGSTGTAIATGTTGSTTGPPATTGSPGPTVSAGGTGGTTVGATGTTGTSGTVVGAAGTTTGTPGPKGLAGTGVGGTSGTPGTSGTAVGAAGTSGTTVGAAGTAGTSGTTGAAGTTGTTVGAAGTAGTSGTTVGAAGTTGTTVGAAGTPGTTGTTVGATTGTGTPGATGTTGTGTPGTTGTTGTSGTTVGATGSSGKPGGTTGSTAIASTGPTLRPDTANPSGTPDIGAAPVLPATAAPPSGTSSPGSTIATTPGEAAQPPALLDTWRSLASQRAKMELDRDYTLGFLASRELRDCRCQRSSPAGIVTRIESGEGTAQLEADNQRAVACEHCLQNAFAAWRGRVQKQCTLMGELSEYELEVLQRSDDGNGIPPRCWQDIVAKKGLDAGVFLATPPVTAKPPPVQTTMTVPLPAADAGTKTIVSAGPVQPLTPPPTGMPRFEPTTTLADGFFRPNEPAPIPLREDGRLYVRVFMSSTCAADVLPGPVLARTGDLLLIPYGAKQLSLRSPCGGLAEVYWGREPTPRVSEVFGRNQPLHLQFRPQ